MNREVLELDLVGGISTAEINDVLLGSLISFQEEIRLRADIYDKFDLDILSTAECRRYFCFEKDDLHSLSTILMPHEIVEAYNRYRVTGKYLT